MSQVVVEFRCNLWHVNISYVLTSISNTDSIGFPLRNVLSRFEQRAPAKSAPIAAVPGNVPRHIARSAGALNAEQLLDFAPPNGLRLYVALLRFMDIHLFNVPSVNTNVHCSLRYTLLGQLESLMQSVASTLATQYPETLGEFTFDDIRKQELHQTWR